MDLAERTAPGPLLEARELYRFFHVGDAETFALRGVSLLVEDGEVVAVVGPSGSGKSTLLACLAGLDEPDGGHVAVGGARLTRRSEAAKAAVRAASIGILLQAGNLLGHLTVEQNIRAAQRQSTRRSPRRDLGELLEQVGLADRATVVPMALSGGEAARAGLAVALANDPRVLLADEPTGEVDDETERGLLELIRRRADAGMAVVVVTHSDGVAAAADRTVHLVDGRIVDG